MKRFMRLGRLGALTILAVAVLADSATATQITPANTEVSFHSTNNIVLFHNGGAFRCTSNITGRIPATAATRQVFGVTLTYSNCAYGLTSFGITFDEACHTAAGTPTMEVMGIGGNQAVWLLTLPATCAMRVGGGGCDVTVQGPHTIGNGTVGIGGGVLTGGSSPLIHLNNTLIPDVTVHTGFFCGGPGTGSMTLTGTYNLTSTLDVDGS